jgi:ABC-2 type transport system permease protein
MKAIITLAAKDLRLLSRDHFAMFWVLVFPMLMALFFGSIYSGEGGQRAAMKVIAVDQDQSDFSRAFFSELSGSSAIQVVESELDSARTVVRQGKAVAYLVFLKGAGEFGSVFHSDSAALRAGMDPARKAEAGFLQGLVMQAWFAAMQKQYLSPDRMRSFLPAQIEAIARDSNMLPGQKEALTQFLGSLDGLMTKLDTGSISGAKSDSAGGGIMAGPRIELEEVTNEAVGPRSSWEITFPQSVLWALIGCAAAFGISIVTERTSGTLIRLQLAPISRGQILAGKGLACMIFCLGVETLLLLVARLVFDVRIPAPLLLMMAVLACAVCFVGMMMLISVLGRSEQAVAGAGWAILLIASMTGGGMLPLMFMPRWLVPVSHFSPVKWGILALEGAIWRGFGWNEMALPLLILVGIGVASFSLGVVRLQRLMS